MIKEKLSKAKKWLIATAIGVSVLAAGSQTTLLDTSPVNYPLTANTNLEKLEFLYQSQEALRLQHNEMGRKFREGEITEEEWQRYLKEDFYPKNNLIAEGTAGVGEALGNVAIGTVTSSSTGKAIPNMVNARQFYKEIFKQSKTWEINLDNISKK